MPANLLACGPAHLQVGVVHCQAACAGGSLLEAAAQAHHVLLWVGGPRLHATHDGSCTGICARLRLPLPIALTGVHAARTAAAHAATHAQGQGGTGKEVSHTRPSANL